MPPRGISKKKKARSSSPPSSQHVAASSRSLDSRGKRKAKDQSHPHPPPPFIETEEESPSSQPIDPTVITPELEELLVEFYSERPIFFDQQLQDFKNRSKRDRLLNEIATQLGLSANVICAWFRNMRSMYGKLLKKTKSGQRTSKFTPRQQWTLRAFSFLDAHLVVRSESRILGQVVSISVKNKNILFICTVYTGLEVKAVR